MRERVESVLETIRPLLQRDGGDIELVRVDEENRVVHVRLRGACSGCPGAAMTLKGVVEEALRKEIPEVKEVVAVPMVQPVYHHEPRAQGRPERPRASLPLVGLVTPLLPRPLRGLVESAARAVAPWVERGWGLWRGKGRP